MPLPPELSGPGRAFGSGPFALVVLENGADQPPTYVVATKNFWVVTRYNRSSYYALAVAEFAEVLAAERERLNSSAPAPTLPPPPPGR
jgi:membrane-bound lytic murein transglycosylase B